MSDLKIDEDIDFKGKAEIFNDHLTSVFTEEDLSTVPDMDVYSKPYVGALKITVEGVVKQLNSLNPHKASGQDGIPSWFLTENGAIIESFFKNQWTQVRYPINGRKLISAPSLRMGRNQIQLITDPSLLLVWPVKYLSILFLVLI